MPQAQKFLRDQAAAVGIKPRLFGHNGVACGMQTVYGIKHAELQKAHVQFFVLRAVVVPADIVAPPRIADVACRRRKVRKIAKRFPSDRGIPRKTERIPMRARAAIAGKDQTDVMTCGVIQIVIMVEQPKRVQPLQFGRFPLLPIDPPKSDAVFFVRSMQNFEVVVDIVVRRKIEGDLRLRRSVFTERGGEFVIPIFPPAYAVGGVQIQRNF